MAGNPRLKPDWEGSEPRINTDSNQDPTPESDRIAGGEKIRGTEPRITLITRILKDTEARFLSYPCHPLPARRGG